MKRFLRGRKGQNTAEYAILIALIIAAAIGMRTYAQRGMQGRFRDAVDDLATGTSDADLGDFALPSDSKYEQLEPYYRDSTFTVGRDTSRTAKFGTETSLGTAKSAERIVTKDDITRSGKQEYKKWAE